MAATACTAAKYGLFNHICQEAPICTKSDTWFLRPTWSGFPNSTSNSSAVYAQLIVVINVQTNTYKTMLCQKH